MTTVSGRLRAGGWLAALCLLLTWGAADRAAARQPVRGGRLPLQINPAQGDCGKVVNQPSVRSFLTRSIWNRTTRSQAKLLDLLQECCWRAPSQQGVLSRPYPATYRGYLPTCAVAEATGDPAHQAHCNHNKAIVDAEQKLLYGKVVTLRTGWSWRTMVVRHPGTTQCGLFASTCLTSNVCRTGQARWGGNPFTLRNCPVDVSIPCAAGRPRAPRPPLRLPSLPPIRPVVCAIQASSGGLVSHRNFWAEVSPISMALEVTGGGFAAKYRLVRAQAVNPLDAQFKVTPCTGGGARCLTFEAVNFPGHFLRLQEGRIKLVRGQAAPAAARVTRSKGGKVTIDLGQQPICLRTDGRLVAGPGCRRSTAVGFRLLCGKNNPLRKG